MIVKSLNPVLNKLRWVLRLNASSCLFFGVLCLLWSEQISHLIGDGYPSAIFFVGLGLIVNGVHLLVASRRRTMRCYEVSYFALGDAAWVLGTVILVLGGYGFTNVFGVVVAVLIAGMVGTFGWLQVRYGRSACDAGLLSRRLLH